LAGRYSFANIEEFFYDDLDGLQCLNKALKQETEATTTPMPLRTFILKALIKTIEDICDRLEKTHE